jgi:predicted acetyltransferase
MSVKELEDRMRGWLASGVYRAVLFEDAGEVVAYALYSQTEAEVHLRQFFVARARRRSGLGRQAVEMLRTSVWPRDRRLTVSVLVANERGVAFWRAMGYRDYVLSLEIVPETAGLA